MSTVKFTGNTGTTNYDVGRATGESSVLTHGEVYEVPEELAARLVGDPEGGQPGHAGWERVHNFAHLNDRQLRQLAAERNIEGRSKMNRDELLAAVRGHAEHRRIGGPLEPPASEPAGAAVSAGEGETTENPPEAPAAPQGADGEPAQGSDEEA